MRYLHNHYQQLSYFSIFVLVIVMIAAVKEFINYATIEQSTQSEIMQQDYRSDKIAFEENFLIPYLSSATAEYFFQHENSMLGPDEYIVVFVDDIPSNPDELLSNSEESQDRTKTLPIQKSRQQFVNELIHKTQ